MRTRAIWYLGLLLALVMALTARAEARGGGSRRGGGLFSSWRKVKKPSSSSTSSRRHHSGSSDGGSLGRLGSGGANKGYKPLKPAAQSSWQAGGYPRQQLPAGGVHHPSAASLPAGATYHPFSYYGAGGPTAGTGGTFYANANALPPGAVLYPQAPQPSFNPANFIFGMYAAQTLSHGVFGHRPLVTNVYHDNPPAEDRKDRVVVIENGAASAAPGAAASSRSPGSGTPHFLPTSSEAPLPPETSSAEPQAPPAEGGIVCVPLLLNETDPGDATQVRQVERIVCYPVPAAPPAGIICVPRSGQEEDSSASSDVGGTPTVAQDCYPAPPPAAEAADDDSTKAPESVIGNIAPEPEDSEQTHAVLETLRQEEQKTMSDFFGSFESRGMTQ